MTVRKLDDNGDIVTRGQQFLGGKEEIAQTVMTRLRLFLGEYFRDITDGTPWYEQILGKFASLSAAEAALRARIANTPGVIRLTSFSADFDINARRYSVTAGILTAFGLEEVTLDG
ncbi:hypothetical protein [Pseudomonas vancouverensis]|uniref:DUF2634 domain-containing protein n=1 Tax=Pseudomonas vancouverensis TaxID=95300 RepID=A0A1H2MV37_PSEVA|nr:hypothetical protein [Pseudomonas vancouverensis]KAB0489683.1 hypothetical protein F7R09_28615 [Pseudomonas vancouverensis]TDB67179.1 hypothetical protein EIY72_03785 [Pseudomonas vancouverensis]SDU97097.1 hypothetical protein SAMN05216558_1319 [Pseudomonas vancouverensis]